MKAKWIGLVAVAAIAVVIIASKARVGQETPTAAAPPRVILVADLSEADEEGDACAEIIQAVRTVRKRGVSVQEFNPDSKSLLIARYRVLMIPTVLILDEKGEVVSRYEGEDRQTLTALRSSLEQLK
jgi:hypothetical protein